MAKLLKEASRTFRKQASQMNSFASNCLFFTCFAVFTTFFGKLLLHFDINKRSYNHVPGECGIVPNLPGILSLATTTGGRLYMTTNSKDAISDQTHLFTFYPDNRTAREIEIKEAPPKWRIKPGPMSVTTDTNNPNIFVLNRRTKNVDVFETNEYSDAWKLKKSLKNKNFERLTDLAASGPNTFYFVKESIFGSTFNLFERIIPVATGQLLFSKGQQTKHMAYVSSPTGITFDSLRETLFVTSFARNSIYALKIKDGYKIESTREFHLGCSPTSIWMDFDGSFLVTCQQIRFRFILHKMDITSSSSSQILRVTVPVNDDKDLGITQLYSNDGATISMANMTVRAGRSLLISNGQKILNCHL